MKRAPRPKSTHVELEPLVEVLVGDDVDGAEEGVHAAALGRDADDGHGALRRLLPRLHVVLELPAHRVHYLAQVDLGPGVLDL